MVKKKRVLIKTPLYFDGKRYNFSKAFMKKPQANKHATKLREEGQLARVISKGIIRKKWLVYVRG